MPTVAFFYGITIRIFFDDHPPPHFHAEYGGDMAEIAIETGEVIKGYIPRPAARLVKAWATERRGELRANWLLAQAGGELEKIKGPER